jgi:hypothetical protein
MPTEKDQNKYTRGNLLMPKWRNQFRFSSKIILLTHTKLRTDTMATRTKTWTEQIVQMKVGACSLNGMVWSRPRLDR